MSFGYSRKIINLSTHSFAETVSTSDNKSRRFSNVNTKAVIYSNEVLQQLFTGLYLDQNLHNAGSYRWLTNSGSHRYEGKFFLNNLHGYGKLVYPNDSLYEGLFYFNKKFGPGVITYTNHKQDVGLWNGNYLIRIPDKLSISDHYKEYIPKLSGLVQSKLYLLQFKRLVPIQEKFKDPAKDILTNLGAPDNVLAMKSLLYLNEIRNRNSMFIDGEKLYKNFFIYEDELHTTVDVIDHFDENDEPVILKLEVQNLIAWNNEEINTEILKHAFLNRHYEKMLSYKIKDLLCNKKRGNFLPPGPIEIKSMELLAASRSADPKLVKKLITEYDLYPDVADCRGNNTVTYATLSNQIKNIRVLSEHGANLNSFNDDCITPLMFGILNYIAIKYNITSTLWETAFIYDKTDFNIPPDNQQWPTDSTTSLNNNSTESFYEHFDIPSLTSISSDMELNFKSIQLDKILLIDETSRRESLVSLFKDYAFPLDCSKSKKISNARKTTDMTIKSRQSGHVEIINELYQKFKNEEMQKIYKTLSTLLLCGANPNLGEVPFCPIITAIFTRSKDIIQMLISFNANVNVKTCDYIGYLGPLHVIASLSPCEEQLEMAFVFLENGAHVDDLTNNIHWLEERNILLADVPPNDCLEKTPLHLVCMRYDFNDDVNNYLINLALMFIQYGANLNLKYLGHSPLTLAMMRGNIELMENLLETGLIDPNEGLGYNMGVPLTICILSRYSKILNSNTTKQLYSVLMQYYANPFNDVPNFNGNAIEFFYNENIKQNIPRRSSLSKGYNGAQLLNYAKTTILKYIESKVVQTLYHYKIICDFDSVLYNNIVKYLTHPRSVEILQILIDHDEIIVNKENIEKLLSFIDSKCTNEDLKYEKSDANYVKFYFKNYMPELDKDESKYKVCFECFKKTNQTLVLCPKCEMVYFCSEECNIKNNKDPNSGHPCKNNFYKNELYLEQLKRKRTTKMENLFHKSVVLLKLLELTDMNLEEFSKLKPNKKRQSIRKMKEKEKEKEAKEKLSKMKKDTGSDMKGHEMGKEGLRKGEDHKSEKDKEKDSKDKDKEKDSKDKDKEKDSKDKASKDKDKDKEKDSKMKDHKESLSKTTLKSQSEEDDEKNKELDEDRLKKAERARLKSKQDFDAKLQKVKQLNAEDEELKDTESSISDNAKRKSRKKSRKSSASAKRKKSRGKDDDDTDDQKRKSRSKKRSRSKSRGSKSRGSSSTDFGEDKYNKINLHIKQKKKTISDSEKYGFSVFVGSKKPVIDIEKRNMYLKLRAQMLEKDRELNARKKVDQSEYYSEKIKLDKDCTEQMLELARKRIPDIPKEYEALDVKFWQLFSPYCIYQTGQLYYNFNDDNNEIYFKITYSSV